jgi:threonine synthase
MRYVSTRGRAPELTFEEAMLTGLARDGGLYVPAEVPRMSAGDIAALAGLSYEEVAFRVMRPFIGDTFTDAEFADLIARAYAGFGHAARAPLKQLQPNHFLLELFHGPTLAFKDFAMQLIGQMFRGGAGAPGRAGDHRRRHQRATPDRPRWRRSAGSTRCRSSSFSRTVACRRFSAAR